MVIMRLASNPVPANAGNDPTLLPAYRAMADYLMPQGVTPQMIVREWLVKDIAGKGMIDINLASLFLLVQRQLATTASCSHLVASHKIDCAALSIGKAGATMMGCPPALMGQEARQLALLPTLGYCMNITGALVLTTPTGEIITARCH
jgi:heat shock protein HslJ